MRSSSTSHISSAPEFEQLGPAGTHLGGPPLQDSSHDTARENESPAPPSETAAATAREMGQWSGGDSDSDSDSEGGAGRKSEEVASKSHPHATNWSASQRGTSAAAAVTSETLQDARTIPQSRPGPRVRILFLKLPPLCKHRCQMHHMRDLCIRAQKYIDVLLLA